MNLCSRNEKFFLWAGKAGFGFRLLALEMQVYLYPPNEWRTR